MKQWMTASLALICMISQSIWGFSHTFNGDLILSQLSVEEKVGQLLMVHFHGEAANEEARRLIEDLHIGGIIYYNWANGLDSPMQVAHLSQGLQKMASQTSHSLPLFIAVDQEGGVVNRLKNGFTLFPSNYALGLTDEYTLGKECARIMGEELKAAGVSLNLAPVADVYTNPANPVIGIRAFSSDPVKVAFWAGYSLQGYQERGIIGVLKHFPGHGDSAVDSHKALPIILKTRWELYQCELLPFRLLAEQAKAILTAHLMFPDLDPDNCVTFSKKIVVDLLRNEFGFQGVILTDSLAMEGILSQCSSSEEVVLKSLEAGHDIALLGGKQLLSTQNGLEFTVEEVSRIHQFLVEAVKTGRLAEKRVDESVSRILALKNQAGLFDDSSTKSNSIERLVGTTEHLAFAKKVARRALQLKKGNSLLPLSFTQGSILIVAPEFLRDELDQTSWGNLGPNGKIIYFKGCDLDQKGIQAIEEEVKSPGICVFFASQIKQSAAHQKLYSALRENAQALYVLSLRDPIDEEILTSSDLLLFTYGQVPCSLQAAYDYLNEHKCNE